MRYYNFILLLILSLSFSCGMKAQNFQLSIKAEIQPDKHKLNAEVTLTFPEGFADKEEVYFHLHKNLIITESSIPVDVKRSDDTAAWYKRYRLRWDKKTPLKSLVLKYEGTIYEDPDGGAAEYARGFSQTRGIISEKGVYLAGSSLWLPSFGDELLSFDLSVQLPKNWKCVSQGSNAKTANYFRCEHPQEEVYLIAAPFHYYSIDYNKKKLEAYLRSEDEKLAQKYLQATKSYMEMYEKMLGPYPYEKFSLVENFWETGYGMPSFTLLGQKVIRFPFILYSSYPHELLHNYWGNSVYVDYDRGNWCEGITAYMADHMLKEQKGQGAEYRRATLQKFTDFVNPENDFPLSQFISRNNSAQEAIGYGKCLMMNHMLRKKVGDEIFLKAYQEFYKNNIYMRVSYKAIEEAFSPYLAENDLSFFNQWVNRTGAPALTLEILSKEQKKSKALLRYKIIQTQEAEAFTLEVPVYYYFKDRIEKELVKMTSKEKEITLSGKELPLRIEVDPQFDVFRSLDKREVPSSLSQIMGSSKIIIILPEEDENMEAWENMAETWRKTAELQGQEVTLMRESEFVEVPKDQSIWVFGKNNKLANEFMERQDEIKQSLDSNQRNTFVACLDTGSVVLTLIQEHNPDITWGWVSSSQPEAIGGLTRLLPHYGKYSVLGFSGQRPNNQLKMILKPNHSPLHHVIDASVQDLPIITPAPALVKGSSAGPRRGH
jgi:aminopeptidase N